MKLRLHSRGSARARSQDRKTHVPLNFPEAEATLPYDWHEPAVRLYTNWLSYLVEHRHPDNRTRTSRSTGASQAA